MEEESIQLLSEKLAIPDMKWGKEPKVMTFSSYKYFNIVLQDLGCILESEIEDHPYNSFGLFQSLYQNFLKQKKSFDDFFCDYTPGENPESLTCVGMSLSLCNRISTISSTLKQSTFTAACWYDVKDVDGMLSNCLPPSKPDPSVHILVVVRFSVEGRPGYLVLYPGDAVLFPITVMADGLPPHTGSFKLLEGTSLERVHEGFCLDGQYIKYQRTRNQEGKGQVTATNMIYVGRPFLNLSQTIEKMRLMFPKRYYLLRCRKQLSLVGGFIAGFEEDVKVTFLCFDKLSQTVTVNVPYAYLLGERDNFKYETVISQVLVDIGMSEARMLEMLDSYVMAISDTTFSKTVSLLTTKIYLKKNSSLRTLC